MRCRWVKSEGVRWVFGLVQTPSALSAFFVALQATGNTRQASKGATVATCPERVWAPEQAAPLPGQKRAGHSHCVGPALGGTRWLHVGEKRPFAPTTLSAGSGRGEQAAGHGHPATEGALELGQGKQRLPMAGAGCWQMRTRCSFHFLVALPPPAALLATRRAQHPLPEPRAVTCWSLSGGTSAYTFLPGETEQQDVCCLSLSG